MPSIKSCLSTIALISFFCASTSATSDSHVALAHARRYTRPSLARRHNEVKDLTRRKLEASRRATLADDRRRSAEIDETHWERAVMESVPAEASLEKRKTTPCTSDATCNTSIFSLLNFANRQCINGACTYVCQTGYLLSGAACVLAPVSCALSGKCPTVADGYSVCSFMKACTPQCQAGTGLSLYSNSAKTKYSCLNTVTDALNCGTPGNVCPGAYNGVGTASCVSSKCTLTCPTKTTMVTVSRASGSITMCK